MLSGNRLALCNSRAQFSSGALPSLLKFDKNRHVDAVLDFLQVRRPQSDGAAASRRSNAAIQTHQSSRSAECIASGRRYATRARPIRHVCGAMSELPPESDVLARHPIKSARSVPRLERVTRIFREVWGS